MKLTIQMPSSTSFMPRRCPARTVEMLTLLRCMQMRPQAVTRTSRSCSGYVHNLKDVQGNQTSKGASPFSSTSTIKTYDPPYSDSKLIYDHIKSNLSDWIEAAIK